MSSSELLAMMKGCASENKDLPIKLESREAIKFALTLIANQSDKSLKGFVKFYDGVNNELFDALTSDEVEKCILSFLSEEKASISIVTNKIDKFKNSRLYKNAPKRKFNLRSFPQQSLDSIETEREARFYSFIVGDEESIMLGKFDLQSPDFPSFVNFGDENAGKLFKKLYQKIEDFVLNGGEYK